MIAVLEFQENTEMGTENMDISLIANEIEDSRDRYEYVFSYGKLHILQFSKQLGMCDVIQGALSCCNLSHSSTRISENMKRMENSSRRGHHARTGLSPIGRFPSLRRGMLAYCQQGEVVPPSEEKKERVRSSKEKRQTLLRICPGKEGFR